MGVLRGIVGVHMLYDLGRSLGILCNGRIRALSSHGFPIVLPSYLHTFVGVFVMIISFPGCVWGLVCSVRIVRCGRFVGSIRGISPGRFLFSPLLVRFPSMPRYYSSADCSMF